MPAPAFTIPPSPETAPPSTASSEPVPRATWKVRLLAPSAIGLAKVSVLSASVLPKRNAEPSGRNEPEPHVTGAAEPPRLTVRAAPVAAKPPAPVNCTSVAPVPRGRVKSPAARSMTPPPSVRLAVPPVAAMPPGRAVALARRSTPPETTVAPV